MGQQNVSERKSPSGGKWYGGLSGSGPTHHEGQFSSSSSAREVREQGGTKEARWKEM